MGIIKLGEGKLASREEPLAKFFTTETIHLQFYLDAHMVLLAAEDGNPFACQFVEGGGGVFVRKADY